MSNSKQPSIWRIVFIAGFCGGLAEVIWITLYTLFVGNSLTLIGVEITNSLFLSLASTSYAAFLGLLLHFMLAELLAIGFALGVWLPFLRYRSTTTQISITLMVLAIVWWVNFYWLLPQLNATFVTLMPSMVTLTSKLLFGAAMIGVLYWSTRGLGYAAHRC